MKTTKIAPIIFALLFGLLFTSTAHADGLALLEDYNNKFYIFNQGTFEQIEHSKVKQYYVGEDFCVYIDYLGYMKVFYDGKWTTLSGSVETFQATEKLISWKIANYLYVWHKGFKKEISRDAKLVKMNGDIIYFEDEFDNALKIYYKEQIYTFAENHYSLRTKALSVGRKSLGVLDGDDQLFVFDRGKMQVQKFMNNNVLFSAGSGGVVVKNIDNGELQLITGLDVITIDYYPPEYFKTEYTWIVWQEQSGNMNYYENGQKNMLTYQRPDLLEFSPESILFENGKRLYLHTRYNETQVCEYIPNVYAFYNELFIYHNREQQTIVVDNGKSTTISSLPGAQFTLYYDTAVITEGRKQSVYYNGKVYKL
ncbi:MAG: hypothetical protein PF489_10170 [Salinivirgaceae bacterium]|jgi:hypothetical protein|nr:hypothetical protein [Salinivirgaceae bacterium]